MTNQSGSSTAFSVFPEEVSEAFIAQEVARARAASEASTSLQILEDLLPLAEELGGTSSHPELFLDTLLEVYTEIAWFAYRLSLFAKSEEFAHKVLDGHTHSSSSHQVARTYNILGLISVKKGIFGKAHLYYDQALSAFQSDDLPTRGIPILINKAHALIEMGDTPQAIALLEGTYARLHPNTGNKNFVSLLLLLGQVYGDIDDFATALEHTFAALEFVEPGSEEEGQVFTQIGSLHFKRETYSEALEYFLKALAIAEKHSNSPAQVTLLSNLGATFAEIGDFDEGLLYFSKALHTFANNEDTQQHISLLLNMGTLYLHKKLYDNSLSFIKRALDLAHSTSSRPYILRCLNTLNKLYIEINAPDLEAKLLQSLGLAEEYEDLDQISIASIHLFRYYKEQQRFEEALSFHEKYFQLHKEAEGQRNSRHINNLFILHNTELIKKESAAHHLRSVELAHKNQQILQQKKQLEEKNRTLERLYKERRDLLNIAAHDLRTPLATVRVAMEKIATYYDKLSKERIIQSIGDATLQIHHIAALLTRILESEAIEDTLLKSPKEEFSPYEVLRSLIMEIEPLAEAKEITISFKTSGDILNILGYKEGYVQIAMNLLTNAIKYSYPSSTIVVSLKSHNEAFDSSGIELIVRDYGVGLSPSELPSAFRRFSKLSSTPTAGEESVGMGLYIVKKLTDIMNGSVSLDSEGVGRGCTVTVALPSAP